jgi:hypothetical protein
VCAIYIHAKDTLSECGPPLSEADTVSFGAPNARVRVLSFAVLFATESILVIFAGEPLVPLELFFSIVGSPSVI